MSQPSGLQIFSLRIKVPKHEASFLYFQLEANEGLCFYSTLNFEEGQNYREIHIQGDISTKAQLESLLSHYSKSYSLKKL